jgi:nicotinamide riboside kinase
MVEQQREFAFEEGKSIRNIQRSKFSDYIVYVDESGDHSFSSIDGQYPVFVLAFCVFFKKHYVQAVVPELQKLKFDYFGHDLVILHENEIRKEKHDFRCFRNRNEKQNFIEALNSIIQRSNFVLISCVVDKRKLDINQKDNLYHVALARCLESLYGFVQEKQQEHLMTHVIVERRGKKEDQELELAFRRICDGANKFNVAFPFQVRMAAKSSNSAGLQLADLMARPIGRHVLNPTQDNRAFMILKEKFYCEGGRENVGVDYDDWGLKYVP